MIQFHFIWRPKPIERASPRKTNQVSQTDRVSHADHQVDRVVYIDEPPVKQPSAATKAFVRNLGSSSVQQHMNWESDSLNTQRTGSDVYVDFWRISPNDFEFLKIEILIEEIIPFVSMPGRNKNLVEHECIHHFQVIDNKNSPTIATVHPQSFK